MAFYWFKGAGTSAGMSERGAGMSAGMSERGADMSAGMSVIASHDAAHNPHAACQECATDLATPSAGASMGAAQPAWRRAFRAGQAVAVIVRQDAG